MSDPIEAAAIGDRLKLLRILLSHASEIGAIIGYVDEVKAATTLSAKWDAIKGAGDILVPIAEELKYAYESQHVGMLAVDDFKVDALARGIDWDRLLALLPKLQEALPLLLKLIDLFGGD